MNRSRRSYFAAWGCLVSCFFLFFAVASASEAYKGPGAMVTTRDGSAILICCYDAQELAVFDVGTEKIAKTIPLGKEPNGVALGPDPKTVYVTSGGYAGVLQAVDFAAGKILKEVPAGHTPTGAVVTPDGKKIFVCNRFSGDVSEYDLPGMTLVKRIPVIREPRGAVVTPDGRTVLVVNGLPNDPTNFPDDEDAPIDVAAEVSLIDVASGKTRSARLPNGSGSCNGICISPDGRYVYVTEILARFQMPTTQLERGWMNTNGISIIDTTRLDDQRNGFVNTVLLDDVDLGAANPYGITTSADGKQLFVALSGTDELVVVDAEAMHKKLASIPEDDDSGEYATGRSASARASDVPNDLAFLVGMKKRISLKGKGARNLVALGSKVYVGMYFSDVLQRVDLKAPGRPQGVEIALGPKPEWTPARRGEIHWNDASLCFQRWQSCASCHPDARMDAYNWDLLNDGQGNPKNAKSLLWCHKTPPAMWTGVRATSAHCTRTGFQYILFTMPDDQVCADIGEYLHGLDPVPSPYLVDGKLSEKARRGKAIFEDPKVGCAQCHPGPLFTDMKVHNVKTKCYYDQRAAFDTPTLVECWRTAPYLHDGRYKNMKDVFKLGKHGDVLGDLDSLTDEQLDELVEYVLSL